MIYVQLMHRTYTGYPQLIIAVVIFLPNAGTVTGSAFGRLCCSNSLPAGSLTGFLPEGQGGWML
jgi:hypothetical protein